MLDQFLAFCVFLQVNELEHGYTQVMCADIVQCYGRLCVEAQYQSAIEQAWIESETSVLNCLPLDTCEV